MFERIIFDLDGTLISGVDFNIYAKLALDEIGYSSNPESLKNIQLAIEDYENNASLYDIEVIAKYFDKHLKSDVGLKFIKAYLLYLCNAVPSSIDKDVLDALNYLYKKYKLSILTNWFQSSQESRIFNAGIYNYFDSFIYGDEVKKPNKEAFIKSCSGTDISKCIYVGDKYEIDYLGSLNAGIDAILIDKDDKYKGIIPDNRRVLNIKELKNIL